MLVFVLFCLFPLAGPMWPPKLGHIIVDKRRLFGRESGIFAILVQPQRFFERVFASSLTQSVI